MSIVNKIIKEAETVYHGTDDQFDVYDMNQSRAMNKFGIWFTDSREFAEMFGSSVKEASIELHNPYVISAHTWDDIRMEHAKDDAWFASWKQTLLSKGHDGLKVTGNKVKFANTEVTNPTIYAVFDVKSIK